MKKFLSIVLPLFLIAGCSSTSNNNGMKAGTYEGTGEGFHGEIKLNVTVDETSIKSIDVVEENETESIGKLALPKLVDQTIADQTSEPDVQSGATLTSKGFTAALQDALTKAGADVESMKGSKTASEKESVEETYDVAVVGAGASGLSAALTALQNGKSVVLLEKTGFAGGASAMAGAGTVATGSEMEKESGMNDTPEALKEDMLENGHHKNDEGTLDIFVNTVGAAVDWLVSEDGGNVEYQPSEGPARTFSAVGRGSAVVKTLTDGFEKQGGTFYTNTKATELVVEDGKVTGVKAESDKNEYTIHAGSVILSCGGFGHNDEMVPEEYKAFVYAGHAGADGDGLKMAEAVDADTVNMDLVNVQPNSMIMPSGLGQYTNPGVGSAYNTSGAFLVNQDGVRFANEQGSSYDLKNAQAKNEKQYLICDETSFAAFNKGMEGSKIYTEDDVKEWLENDGSSNPVFVKADSIDALAKKLNMDASALEETVDTFNKNVGKEDSFGRTSKFALNTDGAVYAIELCNRYYATLGGLHINSDMQVLNKNQEAVEGLYASGEVVGGLEGDIYYPGSLFSWAITSGHNAGLSVSK